MKKSVLFLVFAGISSFAFAKKDVVPVDNTFPCLVKNNSDYDILIDDSVVPYKKSEVHNFPLHEAALYDGWTVTYRIPLLGSAVYYNLSEKKALTDNQETLVIENPSAGDVSESYIVIKNNSKNSVSAQGLGNGSVFACYNSGIVNDYMHKTEPIYSIAAFDSAVIPFKVNDKLCIFDENKRTKLSVRELFQKGYVFSYLYDGNRLILQDKRPLKSLKEKLWNVSFDSVAVPRTVLQKNNNIYSVGTEVLSDSNGNLYVSSFLQCNDSNGSELWHKSFGLKGTDTLFFDAKVIEENKILVVGQVIKENPYGLVILYDLQGTLQKNIQINEVIGIDKIYSKNSKYYICGYDASENEVEALVFNSSSLNSFNFTKKNVSAGIESLLQEISCCVLDKNQNEYAAGESAQMEKPFASIIKVTASGDVSSLYTASEPNSFILDLKINHATDELLFCGSLLGKDQFGNAGKPFLRCIDIKTGKVNWECIYENTKYEAVAKIASCDDYGFVLLFVNSDNDGVVCAPCALFRTNSVGKIDF